MFPAREPHLASGLGPRSVFTSGRHSSSLIRIAELLTLGVCLSIAFRGRNSKNAVARDFRVPHAARFWDEQDVP